VDVVGIGGGYLLVLMIEVPHSIHAHSKSSLYIYNAQCNSAPATVATDHKDAATP